MSYLQRKVNWARGVRKFLEKNGHDVSGSGRKSNKIMVEFLKEHNLPFEEWNFKYKGLNTADLVNAEVIQENFPLFRKWVENGC